MSKFAIKTITPQVIMSRLMRYHTLFHFYHLETTSYEEHKTLDEVYKELVELKDEICEYLLGVMAPARFGSIETTAIPSYSAQLAKSAVDELFLFSVEICDYADSNKLEELCNLASELQKVAAKAKYFYTLK